MNKICLKVEHLLVLSLDTSLKSKFKSMFLTKCWIELIRTSITCFSKRSMKILLSHFSTNMYKVGLFVMTHIKTKTRNKLNVINSLLLALVT